MELPTTALEQRSLKTIHIPVRKTILTVEPKALKEKCAIVKDILTK